MEQLRSMLKYVPEFHAQAKHTREKQRLIIIGSSLLGFGVLNKIPLYGIEHAVAADASIRGTIMELGVAPIVTSSFVMQFLVGSKIIAVNPKVKEELKLLNAAQKLMGMAITLVQAAAYAGSYGNLGVVNSVLVTAQLFIGGVMVMALDELLEKRYKIESVTSLISAMTVCESITWSCFSPTIRGNFGRGMEFEGSIVALMHGLLVRRNKMKAIAMVFFRRHLPNIWSLLSTVTVFMVVIYLQSFKILLRVSNQRGQRQSYPIKLFYTSTMPLMLTSALLGNLQFLSRTTVRLFGSNFFTNVLGRWVDYNGQLIPIGGIVYYLTPPSSLSEALVNPLHMVMYLFFTLMACTLISRLWINVSRCSSKHVAQKLVDQGLTLPGHRQANLERELDRYIPVAAALGGLAIGVISVSADVMGAIGSGTGIFLVVTVLSQLFDSIHREY